MAHARAGRFITPLDGVSAADAAGGRVGPFRLLERIAQGGMGDVYRAERVEGDFTQHIAVKLIAARLDGAEPYRRFRAERQILASLKHPNIVTLLDGGVTATGQPYIAMEYVDGLPITDHCRKHALPLDARLRLFVQVAAAVRFAHRNLVVHRDLKPANVLVTSEQCVKVLDFGVAKLLQPSATQFTTTLLGPMTPNYASPEQVRGFPITTASDVYALGVLLYEVITGVRPYETAGKSADEVVTTVVHQQPPRPSTAPPERLPYHPRALRGDLDAIVLRAMAKDPDGRYASAEELGDDLTRFLEGKPVVAREPSFAYLARKAIGRNRTAFTIAGFSLVLLVAALVGAIWQARVAAAERERAVRRFNDVRSLADALIFRIHDEVTPLAGSTPVRKTIVAEALKYLERLERESEGDPQLQVELARAYLRIGQVQGDAGSSNLGDPAGARASYRKAQALVAPLAQSGAGSWEAVSALADAEMLLVGLLDGTEGRRVEAQHALALAMAWHRREPDATRARLLLARAEFRMAEATGYPGSLPHWIESDRLFTALLEEAPADRTRLRNAALTAKYLGAYFEEANDLSKALEHHRRAYALDSRRVEDAWRHRSAERPA